MLMFEIDVNSGYSAININLLLDNSLSSDHIQRRIERVIFDYL